MVLIDYAAWAKAAAGGALIGAAATLMLLFNGRIAGVSGILGGLLIERKPRDVAWRILFLIGLAAGGFLFFILRPTAAPIPLLEDPLRIGVAGVLVGFGTRLGSGCTSGHGVCGLARLSKRSLIATVTFMGFGFLTVFVLHHLWMLT